MPNLYETLLIVTPEADDEGINAVIGDLRTVVEADEGTMLQARIWERNRKLAYQVKGKTEGHYVLLHSEGTIDLPQLLKAKMKLDEAVIRSIVVRLEGPHEVAARKELDELEGDQTSVVAEQKAAAERRAIARAAAATRTTAEVVADEEALEAERAAATVTPAIVGVDSSEAATSAEETPEAGPDLDVEAEPASQDDAVAEPEDAVAESDDAVAESDDAVAESDAAVVESDAVVAESDAAGDEEPAVSPDSTGPDEGTPEETAPQADADEAVADEEEKES